MTIKAKLTSKPKLEASKELLEISKMLMSYGQGVLYWSFRGMVHYMGGFS